MPKLRTLALIWMVSATLNVCLAADAPAPAKAREPARTTAPTLTVEPTKSAAASAATRAVMSGEQVVEILDETVSWYRTLGAQEQSATQPSDLLILYANRQTAEKVISLAFGIARANAELLSSDAEIARQNEEDSNSSPQALQRLQLQLEARRTALQTAITAAKQQILTGPAKEKAEVEARLAELESELDLVNARRNFVGTMSQFVYQSDGTGAGASALKEHIDAIAASIPLPPAAPPRQAVLRAAAQREPRRALVRYSARPAITTRVVSASGISARTC